MNRSMKMGPKPTTMTKVTQRHLRRTVSIAIVLTVLAAAGCKNFFPPLNGTGSTVVNTGDYAYVASINTASANNPILTLSGFSIGAGTLTALSGFPLSLPFAPTLTVVNPANTMLFVAGNFAGTGVIYGYTISPNGGLTPILNANQAQALANANIVSMVISPDGQWLLALDASFSPAVVDEFQIGYNGLLTLEAGAQYALVNSTAAITPSNIAVAPTGNFVAVSLGMGGDVLFGFDTSTGILTPANQVNVPTSSTADQALTFDAAGATLYIARSGTDGGVIPYIIGNGGTLNLVNGAPFALGNGPSSILIDASGKYLYVGNKTDSTISGFSIANGGVLTALSGSPYPSGTNVDALGFDNSGKYILATASGGAPDLKMYSFDATTAGKLDPATTASTGDLTEPAGAVAIALTH